MRVAVNANTKAVTKRYIRRAITNQTGHDYRSRKKISRAKNMQIVK